MFAFRFVIRAQTGSQLPDCRINYALIKLSHAATQVVVRM